MEPLPIRANSQQGKANFVSTLELTGLVNCVNVIMILQDGRICDLM